MRTHPNPLPLASDEQGEGSLTPTLRVLFAIRRKLDFLTTVAATISAVGILFACFTVTWVVVSRGLFHTSTVWETEASVYVIIYAALLAAAYTHRQGGQISVRFLADRLTGRAAALHRLFIDVLALGLFVLMTISGWQLFINSWETGWRSLTSWGPPLWIPHLAMPLGAALLAVCLAVDVLIRLCGGTIAETRPEGH